MILSALALDCFDRCPKRYAFEREFEAKLISPLALAYRTLEGSLSSPNPDETAKSLSLAIAGRYEIQSTTLAPYSIARHTGAMIGTIATALRDLLGPLTPHPPIETLSFEWRSGLFLDASGTPHRFALVDHLDDDRIRSEVHSWFTVGELAATEAPLTLHLIVIGAHRNGRRHAAWSKGHLHPVNKSLKFAREHKGTALSGNWKEIWREDCEKVSAKDWLKVMRLDGVLDKLILSREIKIAPNDPRLSAARGEMITLAQMMSKTTTNAPMRRSSCDFPRPCPFAQSCYHPKMASPAELPELFRKRAP